MLNIFNIDFKGKREVRKPQLFVNKLCAVSGERSIGREGSCDSPTLYSSGLSSPRRMDRTQVRFFYIYKHPTFARC